MRLHVQRLADADVIEAPLTTWPLDWVDIGPALEDPAVQRALDRRRDPALLHALATVRHEYTRLRNSETLATARLHMASSPAALQGFAETDRIESELGMAVQTRGAYWSARLNLAAVAGTADQDPHLRLDGSHFSVLAGNWVLGAGSVERWWGPGWATALGLSTHARPVPGLFLRRYRDEAPRSRFLRWLGPYSLHLHAGQLEAGRVVPDAWLLGARLGLKPLPGLDIGLFRHAQFGGENRPTGLDVFADLLLGLDNYSAEDAGKATEPGNQLAGLDIRYSFANLGLPLAAYTQMAGEDEAGGFPSKRFWIFGVEGDLTVARRTLAWHLEYTDTAARGLSGSPDWGVAYEHSIYQSGWRYRGRNLGASLDSDSRQLIFGVLFQPDPATAVQLALRAAELNEGGRTRGLLWGRYEPVRLYGGQVSWQRQWSQWRSTLAAEYFNREAVSSLLDIDKVRVSATGEYRF